MSRAHPKSACRRLAFAATACLCLGLTPRFSVARTWRVAVDGSGDAPTIQAAIDSAAIGDEVLLEPGTYTWTSQGAGGPSMLRLTRGVLLRGEAGRSSTVLDAETNGRILECTDVGGDLEIAGLTFENGVAPVENVPVPAEEHRATPAALLAYESHGGAIDARGNSNPVIRDCGFHDNLATGQAARGGAIFCNDATIVDCEFVGNRAGLSGPTNGRGGAVWCGSAHIARSTFTENVAWGFDAASGGAIRATSAVLEDCVFERNHVECPGGPAGGAVAALGTPRVERCVFRNNTVFGHYFFASGGAMDGGSGTIVECLFIGNEVTCQTGPGRGGALTGSQLTVVRSVFVSNLAMRTEPPGPGLGGAIYATFLSQIDHCTLWMNSAGTDDGIAAIELAEGGTVHASILSGNAPGITCSNAITWSCCDRNDNGSPCGTDGGFNFNLDPGFCSSDPTSGDVSLRADSPCAPAHSTVCGLIGAGDVGCAPETVRPSSWSTVKQMFRSENPAARR
jgi:predicted outer membrane repeat protein